MGNKHAKAVVQATAGKNPKSLPSEAPSKIPKTTYIEDAMKMRPSWRISLVQTVDPWGWHLLTREELEEIRVKLCEYESKTWSEILVRGSYWNHLIECYKLCKEARDRLGDLQLDDLEQLVSLRLGAKQRVWGILDHNILHILWWDPEHRVYPVEKQNT